MSDYLQKAKELIERFNVPGDLQADWDGTNHYELQSAESEDSYFWLDVTDAIYYPWVTIDSSTEEGKRIGYCLEAAALLPRLVKEIERWEL